MAEGDPRTRRPFRFGDLAPDSFEGLVFRLAWAQDRRVVRLKAPDGGLDTLLPDRQRPEKAERGWQAKRHTGAIDWEDCAESLERAVQLWEPTSVTFAFPRNLNAREHGTFVRRLNGAHEDVTVDYWSADTLTALLDSDEGRRIAAAHFESDDPVVLAERMLRAGSPLRSGSDVLDAERAIGEALAAADPDYDWIVLRVPPETAAPGLTPGAMLRLSFAREGMHLHADLVPRHAAPEKRPGVVMTLDDSREGRQARQWLDELMSGGGRLRLRSGIRIAVRDIPDPFGDLLEDPVDGEVLIRAVPEPPPYYARAIAGEGASRVEVDIDLVSVPAPDDWDSVLEGRTGGLQLRLSFRWVVEEHRGESRLLSTITPPGRRTKRKHSLSGGSSRFTSPALWRCRIAPATDR